MAKIVGQMAQEKSVWTKIIDKIIGHNLWQLPVETNLLEELPLKLIELMAQANNSAIDEYGNPFVLSDDEKYRVSFVFALINENNEVIIFDSSNNNMINLNDLSDNFSLKGVGVKQVPKEYWDAEILSVSLCNYVALEETDGINDAKIIIMPICLVYISGETKGIPIEEIKGRKKSKLSAIFLHFNNLKM